VFETQLNPAESTITAWNNRQAFVGLSGGFGSLNVGTVYSNHHLISAGFSASTLPNVVGDVMYVIGGTNTTLDKVGITATHSTLASTTTVAQANAALATAGLANASATSGVNASGVNVTYVASGSVSEVVGTATLANIQTKLNRDATSDLNVRLARANNTSYTVRTNNTVAYTSPVMSGFTVGAQYVLPTQTKVEGGDETTSSATQLSLGYTAGKFAAAAAYTAGESKTKSTSTSTARSATPLETIQNVLTTGAAVASTYYTTGTTAVTAVANTVEVKTKEQMAALSYDLGVAKVSYIYAARDAKDTVSDLSDKTTHSFGVKAPFGKTTAFAIYSMGDQKVLDGTANAAKFDLDGIQVGASYAMSKRTDVYAIYGSQKMDNKANTNDIKDKQYAVGVRHSF
jgi:predicted porin